MWGWWRAAGAGGWGRGGRGEPPAGEAGQLRISPEGDSKQPQLAADVSIVDSIFKTLSQDDWMLNVSYPV